MERSEALERLQQLVGSDLVPLAERYGVTLMRNGKKNKGWAGQVVERYLGLPINSAQAPNFGSWELKMLSLKRLRNGRITVKETMQITMIDPVNVAATPFEQSHLLMKLRKGVFCARLWTGIDEATSPLVRIGVFDLDDEAVFAQVREDYEMVRETIRGRGFKHLTGAMGTLIQPRTKGAGHGSDSRAFYARVGFVSRILNL